MTFRKVKGHMRESLGTSLIFTSPSLLPPLSVTHTHSPSSSAPHPFLFFHCSHVYSLPASYPCVPPVFEIEANSSGSFSYHDADDLFDLLMRESINRVGAMMVFDLVSIAQDYMPGDEWSATPLPSFHNFLVPTLSSPLPPPPLPSLSLPHLPSLPLPFLNSLPLILLPVSSPPPLPFLPSLYKPLFFLLPCHKPYCDMCTLCI